MSPSPREAVALLLTNSANRDERRFPDADRFDVTRAPGQHVAFGFGVHFCVGSSLARPEGRIALEETLKRFPEWEVDWSHAERVHTSTVRGYHQLPIVLPWQRRTPWLAISGSPDGGAPASPGDRRDPGRQ